MEAYVEQGGVSDDATMRLLAQAALKAGEQPGAQYTRTISLANVAAGCVPLINYGPGAKITAPGSTGTLEKFRVKEIALTMDTNGLRAVLVLNDRMTEATIKMAKRQAGLLNGAIISGGSGSQPGVEDTRTPATPTGFTATSDAYIGSGGI